MLIEFKKIVNKSQSEWNTYCSDIPLTETTIEFQFGSNENEYKDALKPYHLALLPTHITTVALHGFYTYGTVVETQPPETHFKGVSEIHKSFSQSVGYISSSVCRLSLNFQYDPRARRYNFESRYFKALLENLPKTIKEVDLSGTDFCFSEVRQYSFEFLYFKTLLKNFTKKNIEVDLSGSEEKHLVSIFKSLPKSVVSINLGRNRIAKLSASISSLPMTINELYLDDCFNGISDQDSLADYQKLFSSIHSSIKKLSLRNNRLHQLKSENLGPLFRLLHRNIEELDISYNVFDEYHQSYVSIMSNLPTALKSLRCRSIMSPDISRQNHELFSRYLNNAPVSIREFDFSQNGLINSHQRNEFLEALPMNIRSLNIMEINHDALIAEEPSKLFLNLPKHITTLSFSEYFNSDISACEKLTRMLKSIPSSVTALDFSCIGLNQWSEDRLSTFATSIPPHVTKIILKYNHLSHLKPTTFARMLSDLRSDSIEVDLSENGFDCFSSEQLHARFECMPEHVRCIWEKNRFFTKAKGSLVLLPFFQIKESNTAAVSSRACLPYNRLALAGDSRLTKARLEVVRQRIASLSPDANQLDLSCCDLNQVQSFGVLYSMLLEIPKHIHSISMRDNHFNLKDDSFKALLTTLSKLRNNIVHIDFSGHKFEYLAAEQIKDLFSPLNNKLQFISLKPGKPYTLPQLIAQRTWPQWFRLSANNMSFLQHSRALLDDYTKADNGFMRFLTLHWNRSNIQEVSRIVRFIDAGIISSPQELFQELEQIELPVGDQCLSNRLCFLQQQLFKIENPSEDREEHRSRQGYEGCW